MEKAQFYMCIIRLKGKITIKIQLLKRIDVKFQDRIPNLL
jgi:hypothetical protein